MSVKVRFSDFSTRSAQRTLDLPTAEDAEITLVAWALVNSLWHPGVGIRLVGVGMSGLDEPARQLELFSTEMDSNLAKGVALDPETRRRLTESIDAVRNKFGDQAISRGARRTPIVSPGQKDSESGDVPREE